MVKQGTLFVISAPSGAGKRTLWREASRRDTEITHTVSVTDRPPRPGEVNGQDYVFLDEDEFRQRIEAGEFVEWAEVHGHLYGTLRDELRCRLQSGQDVVLELDVQGMQNLKAQHEDVVTVFIMPPSFAELERRIRSRGADDEVSISLRLKNASAEMAARHEYDYIIVNDVLEEAAADLMAIFRAERCRSTRYSHEEQERSKE